VRRPGRVAAHDDLLVGHRRARQLPERGFEHGGVVARGVGSRVAGPQQTGERHSARSARAVEVAEQRMEAEAALVVAGRAVLVRMRADERRVDVDHERPGRARAEREGALPGAGAGAPQRTEQVAVGDRVDCPPRRGVGGHRPEERALVAQRAQVAEGIAAVGQHDRQVAHHPAGVVGRAALAQLTESAGQGRGQPEPIGRFGQQRSAGVCDRVLVSVRGHRHSDRAAIALHLQGDPPELGSRPSTSRNLPAQPDRTSAPAPVGALASGKIRVRQ